MIHLVVCRSGETRELIQEVETCDWSREAVIFDLMAGVYDRPLRVLMIVNDSGELGSCRDVSESIAHDILQRAYQKGYGPEEWDRRRDLRDFCEEHAGLQAFNETLIAAE